MPYGEDKTPSIVPKQSCCGSASRYRPVHRSTTVSVIRMHNVVDRRFGELAAHLDLKEAAGIESIPRMPEAWVVRMAELRLEDGAR